MRHMIPKPRSHGVNNTSASAPASTAVAGGQVAATLKERVVLDVGASKSTEEDFRVVELVYVESSGMTACVCACVCVRVRAYVCHG